MIIKKNKKQIKILGAGISGMVAGLTLAKNGYQVEIFEKRSRIGSFFKKDIHSVRNYIYDYDVIQKYKEIGVEMPLVYPVFKEFRFSPSLKCVEIYSKSKPLFYNFFRGYNNKNSLDVKLYNAAIKSGVKFYFGKTLENNKVDIVATGASHSKGVSYGEHYKNIFGGISNSLYIFLNDFYSPHGYSYILFFNNEASIVIASTRNENKENLRKKFDKLKNNNPIIKKITKNAKFENEIYGFAFYDFPKSAVKNNVLYVGEAAGFLDAATGFGSHYAIFSGYLAAISIINDKNYDKLWRDEFGAELKRQYLKRKKLERLDNNEYEKNIEIIINKYGNKIMGDTYKNLKEAARTPCGLPPRMPQG